MTKKCPFGMVPSMEERRRICDEILRSIPREEDLPSYLIARGDHPDTPELDVPQPSVAQSENLLMADAAQIESPSLSEDVTLCAMLPDGRYLFFCVEVVNRRSVNSLICYTGVNHTVMTNHPELDLKSGDEIEFFPKHIIGLGWPYGLEMED